jgi:hypothetical protein
MYIAYPYKQLIIAFSISATFTFKSYQMSDTMIAAAAYLVLTQQEKKKKRRRWWNRELFAQRNLSQESFWSQMTEPFLKTL